MKPRPRKKADLMNRAGWSQEDTDIDIPYVTAATRLLNAQRSMIAYLQTCLKPFAFNVDELYETAAFEDDELIFLRPDDGTDSVSKSWRKDVKFADVRRASEILDAAGIP